MKISFEEIITRTKKLDKIFPHKFDERDRFMDLVEEVGELSQALQITSKRKYSSDPKKQKTIEDVSDALCDVMYDLLLLADMRGIDLESEYTQMLDRLEKRVKEGEFNVY